MNWKIWVKIFVLIPVFIFGCIHSQTSDRAISYSNEKLENTVNRYLDDKPDILGTIVRVNLQDNKSYGAARGYFDRSHTTPMKENDKFIIGSITKMFTAVLVLQLVEEDKVQLGAPLIGYLPADWAEVLGKIEYGGEITVAQALSHRSGIGDVTGDEEFWKDLLTDKAKEWTALEFLRLVQQKGEPKFKPGEGNDYCNTNYLLLGALIEGVTGQPYAVSLQRNILTRIGLKNTFLSEGTFGSSKKGIAHGYYRIDDGYYDGQDISANWALSAGGIISTADDLINFFRALNAGLLFRNRETYEQMFQLAGYNESYGYGLQVVNDPQVGLFYGHSGNFCNTRAILAYFPKNEITIAVCHTFEERSPIQPIDLMKSIIKDMVKPKATVSPDEQEEVDGPFILADQSDVVENEDLPIRGDWDFKLKEVWSLSQVGAHSLAMPGNLKVDDDGRIYLLAKESGEICILDPEGNLLLSFGGYGDGPRFQYASELYITPDNIHVLDIRDNGEKIKTFDREANFLGELSLEGGVSPRVIIDNNQYVAVRSGWNPGKKVQHEKLELLSSDGGKISLLTMITAEERLIASTDATLGRCNVLFDEVEIFPRLITHFNGNRLFIGRSDSYLIKKIDLSGKEELAFAINGRERTPLPPDYSEDRISSLGQVCGMEMPKEMKEQLLTGFPDRHVFFTEITTDEQGLIYVFVPDVIHTEKQQIDIFSLEGKYLYRSVIELPDGNKKLKPLIIKNEYLYALVKSKTGEHKIIKYSITLPSI